MQQSRDSLKSSLLRLAGLYYWEPPDREESFLLINFDAEKASTYHWQELPEKSQPPMVKFGLGLMVMLLSMVILYQLFFYTLLAFVKQGDLGALLLAGALLQLGYAISYTAIADYYLGQDTGFLSTCYRIIRTSLVLLPFSLIPEWMIGCLLWPFVPLRLRGETHFYDHGFTIGPMVKYSLAFISTSPGSLKNNLSRMATLATSHRTRYFDVTTDTGRRILLTICVFMAASLVAMYQPFPLPEIKEIAVWGVPFFGRHTCLVITAGFISVLFTYFSLNGVASIFTINHFAMCQKEPEDPPLQKAKGTEFAYFIPHVMFGALLIVAIYALAFRSISA